MRHTAWIVCLLVSSAAAAETGSFLARPVAPEVGVEVLGRAAATRLVGRTLLGEPAASAVYGEVHLYDAFPYVEGRYVHVTSDAGWQRLLYGEPGDAPRAFGKGGVAPGEFGEPRGLCFAPDGRLFVADRALGRVTVLRLHLEAAGPRLELEGTIDGLVQPMDVAVHDGGTPADPSDDRLLVAEAGAQRVALYLLQATGAVRLAEYGRRGSGSGEFLYPRAVATGRTGGANDAEVYVADSGNHRLVRLELRGVQLVWQDAVSLPMEATSVDTDHHGNVYLAMRRAGSVWKMSPRLERLATWEGGALPLAGPRDVAIPFAWVHDHRRGAPAAWSGQGTAMVLEGWGEATGVRRLDLGVEIASLVRRDLSSLDVVVTDPAQLEARVLSRAGELHRIDLGAVPSGRQNVAVPGLDDAARVTLVATSQYDPARTAEAWLDLAALAPAKLELRQNTPNPFNPTTSIAFVLPAASPVQLEVFDVGGRRVRTLVDGTLDAGLHQIAWDGRDARGRGVGSGVYFYRLVAGDAVQVRKMVMAQ